MTGNFDPLKQPFYNAFWLFGMAALTKYKGEFLKSKKAELGLSKKELQEIKRECNVADFNMSIHFDEMIRIGIPTDMLPEAMQVDDPERDSDENEQDVQDHE